MRSGRARILLTMAKKKKERLNVGIREGNYNKLFPYLDLIKRRINELDYDCFIVVCGKERRGKSTLAAKLGWYLSEAKLTQENICMDMGEFTSSLQKSEKGDVIIFDEAGTNLYSREAMSSINRMLTKAFMVTGLKNLAIILLIPSFFNLDSYIRNHRVDLLFDIPKRGRFKCFSTRRAKKISILGAKWKNMNVQKPNVLGTFTKSWPSKQLEDDYRKKEQKYKLSFIKDLKRNIEGYFTTAKFCQMTGFDLRTLYKWIREKKLRAKRVGKKWFIPKTEADRVVQEYREKREISTIEEHK